MLFLYEPYEDIRFTSLHNEFQMFKAIVTTLNDLVLDLQMVLIKLFVDLIPHDQN